jgi:hypothetical protein
MSANKTRKARAHADEDNITARPHPIAERLADELDEVGVSIDPDELGRRALCGAVQEFAAGTHVASPLSLLHGAPSDAALSGPAFDGENIWERTVDNSLQDGSESGLRESSWIADDADDEDELATSEPSLDLTQNIIRESSLFDSEAEEGDETRPPDVHTDNDTPEHRPARTRKP